MADSMCGPSNALQSFKSHTSQDRSLQQDRLINRPPQAQGFRSACPSTGNVDPEFAAFQAGQFPQFKGQHLQPGGFHVAQRMNAQQAQAGPSQWANDFQNMHISPQPMQNPGMQRGQADGGAAWHQEFHQAQGMGMANQLHGHSTPVERLAGIQAQPFGMTMGGTSMGGMYQSPMMNMRNQGMYNTPPLQQEPMAAPAAVEAFDEEAFARAFDQAAAAELSESAQLSQEMQDDLLDSHEGLDERIGADAIHHPDEGNFEPMTPDQQSDDLARTAGQLLNSVKDNDSDKFQNSVFLQLMRQLRDKEVVVEDDHIRPAAVGGEVAGQDQQTPTHSHASDVSDIPRHAHPELRKNRLYTEDLLEYDYRTTVGQSSAFEPGASGLPIRAEHEMSGGLQETKKVFANIKDQFESIEDRQKAAKEELRQEALRLWKEEMEMDGVTWGEP